MNKDVKDFAKSLGIDPDNPKDFQDFRKNIEWAGTNRKRCETTIGKVITWFAIFSIGGIVALTISGFKSKLGMG
jgi:hypothetical protein